MTGPHPGTIRTTLVIGYGNRLRTDDGAGQCVADAVASWDITGLVAISVHQLTPELSERLASTDLAIFVDARLARGGEDIVVVPVEAPEEMGIHGHVCDPRSLLALARAIYGRTPECWLVTVPSTDFSLGEGLSKTAREGVERALERIAALVGAGIRRSDGAALSS